MMNMPKKTEWKRRKSKWSFKKRKKSEKELYMNLDLLKESRTDGDEEYPSPSRCMPREIRYDSSPASQISMISGTTELDPRPPPSIRSVVPLKAYQSQDPLPVLNKKNILNVEPPNIKRDSLFPNITSDSEDDSLFLNSVNSSGKIRLSRAPMKSAFRKKPKRKQSSWLSETLLKKVANDAFDKVDSKNIGEIDKKDFLYALLFVHLDLSSYLGPVGFRPYDKDSAVEAYENQKWLTNKLMNRENFVEVVVFLYSDFIYKCLQQCVGVLLATSILTPYLAKALSFFLQIFISFFESAGPLFSISYILDYSSYIIPSSIYNTFLSSCVSCLLGIVIIPSVIRSQEDEKKTVRAFKTYKRTVSRRLEDASKKFFTTTAK